jgi:glycosyltransferase involved in cell wall biosynthesis
VSKTSPLISVIMPVFNCESTILQALNSALGQTYGNIEVWVHDDGSTDKTTEVVSQLANTDGRIHLVSGNSHSGLPSVARNAAASHANGKYLAFLDGDDIWTKTKLARQISILEDDSQVALVHSALLEFIRRRVSINGLLHLSPPEIRRADCVELLERNRVQCSSVLMRTDVFRSLGGFNERRELRVGEDYEFWFRIAQQWATAFIPEIHGFYRRTPQSSVETIPLNNALIVTGKCVEPTVAVTSMWERSLRILQLPRVFWTYLGIGLLRTHFSLGTRSVRAGTRRTSAELP